MTWLNEATTDAFKFVAVQVELWKIGNSAPAPFLNIAVAPKDWVQENRRPFGTTATELPPERPQPPAEKIEARGVGIEVTDELIAALASEYSASAAQHWKKWLPKMCREMRQEGTLQGAVDEAGKRAARQVGELMRSGLQRHEAEEFVIREVILLEPER